MAKRKHRLMPATELPVGAHQVVTIGRREIGLFNVEGIYHALPNLCPHQLGPLCAGKVSGTTGAFAENDWQLEWIYDGEIVTCPWHSLEYHIPTGRCLAFPEISIRHYDVVEEDGWLVIEL
ncbi:MAG: Rieske 2Fe-2S domain-containing protein [Chloroflexota bacterium]